MQKSYVPCTLLCGEFFLYSPANLCWKLDLVPLLFYVESFTYISQAVLCGE